MLGVAQISDLPKNVIYFIKRLRRIIIAAVVCSFKIDRFVFLDMNDLCEWAVRW
jgi:hypothetical protein